MLKPIRKCPKCDTTLRRAEIRPAGHFPCPVCQAQLEATSSYTGWIMVINTLVCVMICLVMGLRNLRLVLVALLVWWPLFLLLMAVGRYIVPPKVELGVAAKTTSEILGDARRNISEIWRDEPLSLNLNDKKRS
jgi:hypothetical protein